MGMVAPRQRIASACVVWFGHFGTVSEYARQRGVCRQRIYREADWVESRVEGSAWQQEIDRLRQDNDQLQQRLQQTQKRLDQAVLLDEDKQAEFAAVGQAIGVSLPELRTLLEVLLPGKVPSVATLGRWTQAVGQKAGALLAVLDEVTHPQVRQALADEIFAPQPVLMVVEPESLCWLAGRRLGGPVTGTAWAEELRRLPALEQVARDGGACLGRGVAEVNQQRQEQGRPAVSDQLDHFHILREASRAVGRAEKKARGAFNAVKAAEARLARCQRRGGGRQLAPCKSRLRACLVKAERAMDIWSDRERLWREVTAALRPFTAEGELKTRAQAEARVAELLPQLPDEEFATLKRQLEQPEVFSYLDEIQRKLAALEVSTDIQEAAVLQEGLRRVPELLKADTAKGAAARGLMLACTLVLTLAGSVGPQTVEAVRTIIRSSWRSSSLVECLNSVLRMQQARHRKLTQGLLDLKRLYWNCHRFRTGRRRGQCPYQKLGVPWPEGLRWWDVLKWSPEQLRAKLSAQPAAA
jgi:hypothetical protein